jgi:hypothetical protein
MVTTEPMLDRAAESRSPILSSSSSRPRTGARDLNAPSSGVAAAVITPCASPRSPAHGAFVPPMIRNSPGDQAAPPHPSRALDQQSRTRTRAHTIERLAQQSELRVPAADRRTNRHPASPGVRTERAHAPQCPPFGPVREAAWSSVGSAEAEQQLPHPLAEGRQKASSGRAVASLDRLGWRGLLRSLTRL